MRNFGERLREAAERAGYHSDADAARAAKIEIRAYGNYANGRVPKDPEVLNRLCRTFGTTPNTLFGFEKPGYQQEAGAIAERLSVENRGLWFQYGRSVAGKPLDASKRRRGRAA